jgi:hypothetical protein
LFRGFPYGSWEFVYHNCLVNVRKGRRRRRDRGLNIGACDDVDVTGILMAVTRHCIDWTVMGINGEESR